jgi:hypothetical protein
LDEVCVVGEGLKVEKQEMYNAYERWCLAEDEEPKTPKSFTGLMNEKGVVQNFEDGKSNGKHIWKGISLRESDPETHPSNNVSLPKKSCKHGGRQTSEGHITPDSAKVLGDAPRVERFSENGSKVSLTPQSVPDVVTTPLSWEFEDGVINYRPEAE